jgi:hypothetical protein
VFSFVEGEQHPRSSVESAELKTFPVGLSGTIDSQTPRPGAASTHASDPLFGGCGGSSGSPAPEDDAVALGVTSVVETAANDASTARIGRA